MIAKLFLYQKYLKIIFLLFLVKLNYNLSMDKNNNTMDENNVDLSPSKEKIRNFITESKLDVDELIKKLIEFQKIQNIKNQSQKNIRLFSLSPDEKNNYHNSNDANKRKLSDNEIFIKSPQKHTTVASNLTNTNSIITTNDQSRKQSIQNSPKNSQSPKNNKIVFEWYGH